MRRHRKYSFISLKSLALHCHKFPVIKFFLYFPTNISIIQTVQHLFPDKNQISEQSFVSNYILTTPVDKNEQNDNNFVSRIDLIP